MNDTDVLLETLKKLAEKHNADIYMFSSGVEYLTADRFILTLRQVANRRTNCVLVLATYGGDADAGYRIVRAIKRNYSQLILFVFGSCKSAGTLMALGADKIIMSDFAELGPLDVQLAKDDELINMSGLNYLQSLLSLNEQTFRFFEQNFLNLKAGSGGTISTKTAAEIASKLAISLTSPISGQIDPVKLGEVQRAINIANAYGDRLANGKQNLIHRLITGYPSHSFVIDVTEAKTLFDNVEEAEEEELILEQLLFDHTRGESKDQLIKILLTQEIFDNKSRSDVVQTNKNDEVAPDLTDQSTSSTSEEQTYTAHESPDPSTYQTSKNGKKAVS